MDWFNYMKEQGFFDSSKNPSPLAVENGFQIPSWDALDYLEKIASVFHEGKNLELVPEILYIIKQVSENPVDNYKTWYRIIKILSYVPNLDVSEEYIDYIPVWLDSKFDTMLQTIEICKNLLPKFIGENATDLDIKKAEKILFYLFDLIRDKQVSQGDGYNSLSYKSPFYLYHINESFHQKELTTLITEKSSLAPLYKLSDSLNILLRDAPINAQAKVEDIGYDFIFERNYHDIKVLVFKNEEKERKEIYSETIDNYLDLGNNWHFDLLKIIFENCKIDEIIFDEIFERLDFNLNNDLVSVFGHNAIKDLDEEADTSEKTINTFSYILREWLVQLSIQNNKEKINDVFKNFLEKQRFNLPFFKRILLYVVAENWKKLKPWFWKLIGDNDDLNIFSIDSYKLELYYLLSIVGKSLSRKEADIITRILTNGPKYDKYGTPDKTYWQHRWLDALKESDYFKNWYKELSEEGNFKGNYKEEGKIKVRVGHVSPFTVDEIMEMDDESLIHHIKNFKNKDHWDDPTIEGFAHTLGKATEDYPQRFTQLLLKCEDLSLIYAYYILSGFYTAWKSNRDFDWQELLQFCLNYIVSQPFIDNKLETDDRLKVSNDWVYGNIASLISVGAQNDEHSFENQLLPLIKQILLRINDDVISNENTSTMNNDFVLKMLNSTMGKLLKSFFDYSLKNGRNLVAPHLTDKWDNDVKIIYNQKLEDNTIEAYTLMGMHMPQFMYLDNDWLISQIKKVENLNDLSWSAFMGGLSYGNPLSKIYYDLMYPNLLRVAEKKELSLTHGQGLLRHFFAYYIWDYEESFEQTLLYIILINNPNPNVVHHLITLLNQELKYSGKETNEDKMRLNAKIIDLWKSINFYIKSLSEKDDLKQLSNIIYLSDIIETLNEENIVLVEENMNIYSNDMSRIHLLNAISRWSENSNHELIARLLSKLKIGYVYDRDIISKLLEYLYLNNEHKTANLMTTQLAIDGYDFFRPLYLKYN